MRSDGLDRRTLIALALAAAIASDSTAKERLVPPQIEDVFLLLIVDDVAACRSFYERCFDFTTVFESKVYTQLASPEHKGCSFSLALMPTNHPFGVVPQRAFSGDGIMLTIQTADVDALHAKLVDAGVAVIHGPKSEPWGQRRFDVRDPSGTYIDVVQSIEPEPGWFDQFK
jgi:uncharacterized glyoxalase superfamily protein PhnB